MGKKKHVKFFPGHRTAPVKLLAKVLPGLSVAVVAAVAAINLVPAVASAFPSSVTTAAEKCHTLQYKLGDDLYSRGFDDAYFLAHAFFALTFVSCGGRGSSWSLLFLPVFLSAFLPSFLPSFVPSFLIFFVSSFLPFLLSPPLPPLPQGRYAIGWFFLGPVAKAIGVKKDERGKFVENGWQVLYYTLAWTAGARLMSTWNWDVPSFFAEHPAKGYSAFCG